MANIWDVDVKKFVWRNRVTRFGVPESLMSDNGLQSDSRAFHEYYKDLGIINIRSRNSYTGKGELVQCSSFKI